MLGTGKTDRVFYESFEQQAGCLVRAAHLLTEMFGEIEEAPSYATKISSIEHEGDRITHDTIARLHKTWITPMDRGHIQSLVSSLDDVLDFIEAVGERVVVFEITAVPDDARSLVKSLERACEAVEQAVKLLSNLKQPDKILQLCVEINRLENEGDATYRHALADLYRKPHLRTEANAGSIPPAHEPLDVLKWRDIYDNLETATDRCEDVANILEGVVLEYA